METLPIRNPFPGAVSRLVEATESTQGEARRLAETDGTDGGGTSPGGAFPHGSLVAANAQSSGRGRFPERSGVRAGQEPAVHAFPGSGRRERASDPDRKRALRRRDDLRAEPRRLLRRSAQAQVAQRPDVRGRKAAGILCESGSLGVFAGIGLNCNQLTFPPGLETKATSLALESGREVDRWALLELFLEALAGVLRDADWRRRAESLLWRMGEPALFLPGNAASSAGTGQRALTGTPWVSTSRGVSCSGKGGRIKLRPMPRASSERGVS